MKLRRSHLFQTLLPPGIVFLSLMGLYLRTMAPGLTWANGGSDGGDLITAAATGGIAHPTGYPLYLVLARLFQSLPAGSLAFRTNLMSAVLSALTAVLLFQLVTRSGRSQKSPALWLAGWAAAYAFGLAPLVWSQAVISEVYALQALLSALIIDLYTRPVPVSATRSNGLDGWRGLALGLAVSNQVTGLMLVPIALLLGSVRRRPVAEEHPGPGQPAPRDLQFHAAALARQLLGFGVGLTPYLLLPLRALAAPPVNWGNPVTFERFWWLVTGRLYQSHFLQLSLSDAWDSLQAGAALLLRQFGVAGVLLGMLGLVAYGSRSRLFVLTAWTAGVFSAFSFLYRSPDSSVYLIPAFLCFAIWVGLGVAGLFDPLAGRFPGLLPGIGLLVTGLLFAHALGLMGEVDASQDLEAERFGREVLSGAPQDVILFAEGDAPVFALWYFHLALGERQDLAIVAVDLLHFDWYQENLHSLYPALHIPGPFPWPGTIASANPGRPVCYVRYSTATELICPPVPASP